MPLPTPLSALGSWWRLCGSAEMLYGFLGRSLQSTHTKTPPRFSLVMTHNDERLKDSASIQKLEWVTPKISLMEVGDTDGKAFFPGEYGNSPKNFIGPS